MGHTGARIAAVAATLLSACNMLPGDRVAAGAPCSAGDFSNAQGGKGIVQLLRDCGTRTASEAEALLAGYPNSGAFHWTATVTPAAKKLVSDGTYDVMLCNLSPNRGIVDVAEASPRTRVIIGRSCLEFEAVTDVAALGGRLASEPEGDGQGGGNEEWFGVYLYRPKT